MRRAKVDTNHSAIVNALRKCGCSVQSLAPVGCGVPDILVGIAGKTYLLEIKAANGVLTPAEASWHALWRGHVAIVRTIAEAMAAVGLQKAAATPPVSKKMEQDNSHKNNAYLKKYKLRGDPKPLALVLAAWGDDAELEGMS